MRARTTCDTSATSVVLKRGSSTNSRSPLARSTYTPSSNTAAEHRVDEDPTHGAEQFAVVVQPIPKRMRQRQYPLPQWHGTRQHVINQVGRALAHPSTEARWIRASAFTRESDQPALAALGAPKQRETS
jgi:hypothetical protein